MKKDHLAVVSPREHLFVSGRRGDLSVVVPVRISIAPENCLVVGDRVDTDGKGAFDSGMKYVEIKTHKTKPEYKPNHPLYSFEDFVKEVI